MKGERDLVGIERLLGLKSARGISRQKNLDSPPIKDILERIKAFSKEYVTQSNGDIRSSEKLKRDARAVFEQHGRRIWPGPEEPRPCWLEEPSETQFDGKYPRHLYYTYPGDREILWEHFYHLVVQKCCNYHDNQLQKHRRSSAKLRTEDSELTPGTPRNDDSPEGPDSDLEVLGSERPSWLPINHGDAHNRVASVTPLRSSPVMNVSPHVQNGLPGVYISRTHSGEIAHATSATPKVLSPVAAPSQLQVYEPSTHYHASTEPDEMEIDERDAADVDGSVTDYQSDSDNGQKRKRADADDDDYDDDDEDDRASKRLRSDTEEADDDDRSLVVKLKINNRAFTPLSAKTRPNLHPTTSPASPVGTRTRSSSVAHSTQHADNEGTQVHVKQYKDNKGKWYEVNIESRPHWAVDERVITRTIPPERRRRTWVSRHAAFSPNTLSTSETRGSLGAVSVPSRPSSIAGYEAYNTGRRDSVRSEEQREKEASALAAQAQAPTAVPEGREPTDTENHAKLGETKVEPGLEPEPEVQPLPGSQAVTGSERPSSPENNTPVASSEGNGVPARSFVTALDQLPPKERNPQVFEPHSSGGVVTQPREGPLARNSSLPPTSGSNIHPIKHRRSGSGSKLPDRSIVPPEPSTADASSPNVNGASGPPGSGVIEPVSRLPATKAEPREANNNTTDDQRRSQQPSVTPNAAPAPGALQGVPWPPNPYATQPPTGAPPIQVHGSPFSLSGPVHGHPPQSGGQDPRILNETARFRFVDQNPVFNGSQQQHPSSQHNRNEMPLKPAVPVNAPSHVPQHSQQPHHGPPQQPPPGHNVKPPPIASSGNNAHIPPGLQNGPPLHHHRPPSNAPPAQPQPVMQASPIAQHRPVAQAPPSQQSVKEDPDPQLVFDVLGDLADCPVGQYIQARCPDLMSDRDCLCVVKETLLRVPAARADWTSLEATLKHQCQKDQYFCATAIDKHKNASMKQTNIRRGSPRQPPGVEHQQGRTTHPETVLPRKESLPLWATPLGVDPTMLPKALPAIAVTPRHQDEIRDSNRPQSGASGPAISPAPPAHKAKQSKQQATEPTFRSYPVPPVVPSNGQAIRLPPRPQQRADLPPSPVVKNEDFNEDLLNNTFIEINWGAEEVEYSDHMTMQDCKDCNTADDFFGIIEYRVPDELRGKFRGIKEVRVKALNELQGKDRLPRFVRNNGSVRGGMRSLVKLLKAQPPGTEPELEFLTVWE